MGIIFIFAQVAQKGSMESFCCPIGTGPSPDRNLLDHLKKLTGQGDRLHFAKGQFLFYQGHEPYGLFWLKKGVVVCLKEKTGSRELECREPHDKLLGLAHLLSETPYCASCRAEGNVEVVFLPKQVVFEFYHKQEGNTHDANRNFKT